MKFIALVASFLLIAQGGSADLLVETVEPGLGGHRAGLLAGDRILGRPLEDGSLQALTLPTALRLMAIERGRFPLTLTILRGSERVDVGLDGDDPGLEMRAIGGQWDRGVEAIDRAADPESIRAILAGGDPWLQIRAGRRLLELGRSDGAIEIFTAAVADMAVEDRGVAGVHVADLLRSMGWSADACRWLESGSAVADSKLELAMSILLGRACGEALEVRSSAKAWNKAARLVRTSGLDRATVLLGLSVDQADDSGLVEAGQIVERQAPGGRLHGQILTQLGRQATEGGEEEAAAANLRRAEDVLGSLDPDHGDLGRVHVAMGRLAMAAGDQETAAVRFGRALEVHRRPTVRDLRVEVAARSGLATLALDTGRLDDAQRHLEAVQLVSPTQQALDGLVRIAREREDPEAESRWLVERLRVAGSGRDPESAETLERLAELAGVMDDAVAHRHFLSAAIEVRAELGAIGPEFARSVVTLSRLMAQSGDGQAAAGSLESALDTVEGTVRSDRSLDAALAIGFELVEVRASSGDVVEAFAARQRMRGFEGFGGASGASGGMEELKSTLDKDALLLDFVVGERRSFVFMIGDRGAEVAVIDRPRERLEDLVEDWRAWLERPGTPPPPAGAELSEVLLGEARRRLVRSDRVLLALDGPLERIPFASLPGWERGGRLDPDSFLVEKTAFLRVGAGAAVIHGDGEPTTGPTPSRLWESSRPAEQELLERFEARKDLGSPVRALARAQRDLAAGRAGEELTHPWYWAGWILDASSGRQ